MFVRFNFYVVDGSGMRQSDFAFCIDSPVLSGHTIYYCLLVMCIIDSKRFYAKPITTATYQE